MGSEIIKCLNKQQRPVTWLADALNSDQSNLNKKLQKQHIHPVLLFKIAQVLDVDLFACYSDQLNELKKNRWKTTLNLGEKPPYMYETNVVSLLRWKYRLFLRFLIAKNDSNGQNRQQRSASKWICITKNKSGRQQLIKMGKICEAYRTEKFIF